MILRLPRENNSCFAFRRQQKVNYFLRLINPIFHFDIAIHGLFWLCIMILQRACCSCIVYHCCADYLEIMYTVFVPLINNQENTDIHELTFFFFTRALGHPTSCGLLSLRLIGAVGVNNYVGRSFSQWILSMSRT